MLPSGPSRPLLLLLAIWVAAAAVLPHVVHPVRAEDAGKSAKKVSGIEGLKEVAEDENVPVNFECVALEGVDETIAAIRLLEGVEVTGWFHGVISLRMTLLKRQDLDTPLMGHCSKLIRSIPVDRPDPGPSTGRAVTTPTFDTKEGVKAMQLTSLLASNPMLTGKGVKIGIMSDSFNRLGATSFPCQAVQDLTVVRELPSGGIDEGRAMAELICFVAPEAKLYFYTATIGYAAFAEGIVALQQQGCDIIVDDILYANEPRYSPGLIAQAVNQVNAAGVAYFSSNGNYAGKSWEGAAQWETLASMNVPQPFDEGTYPGWHNWGVPGTGNRPWLQVMAARDLWLQWDEPYKLDTGGAASASSDLDLFICQAVPKVRADYANCFWSILDNLLPTNGDPVEAVLGLPAATATYWVGVALWSGGRPDLRFKLISFRQFDVVPGQDGQTSGAATNKPLANTASAMSIGAARYLQTPGYGQSPAILEDFSSWGVQPIFYTANGTRLTVPTVLLKPDLVGPDGTATSFFQGGDNRFFGSSAAAPHVAAVGALLLQQDPSLQPDAMYAKMRASAGDMFLSNIPGLANDQPTAGADRYTGFGFLNGGAALTQCTSGRCCSNGMFSSNSTICRPAAHPCDVAEMCSGTSDACPEDAKKPDRTQCPWSGGNDPVFGAYMAHESPSTASAMTYQVADTLSDSSSNARVMSDPPQCKGTCKAGICTISLKAAYCCFTALYKPDEGYAQTLGGSNTKQVHDGHAHEVSEKQVEHREARTTGYEHRGDEYRDMPYDHKGEREYRTKWQPYYRDEGEQAYGDDTYEYRHKGHKKYHCWE